MNKWKNGAVPALLLHVCIGSVYCWSLLKDSVAAELGVKTSDIEIAFSLAIFFLGMSAAFCGQMVEKDVKRAVRISTTCFFLGLSFSSLALYLHSQMMFILSYGVLMGVGLGLGYLSPIKTLMIWFEENKGLAAGIAIGGFGLSKVIFSPYIELMLSNNGVYTTFMSMAFISLLLMTVATALIAKPLEWADKDKRKHQTDYRQFLLHNKEFHKIWWVFFLNITCGLAIISFEKDICGAYSVVLAVALVSSLSAVFNTVGRIGFATWSDYLFDNTIPYVVFLVLSILACVMGLYFGNWMAALTVIWVVNLGYGGGFSSLPPLLMAKFGVSRLSTIHGLALSAWGVAGLCGNSLADLIVNTLHLGYEYLFMVLCGLYILALCITASIKTMRADV